MSPTSPSRPEPSGRFAVPLLDDDSPAAGPEHDSAPTPKASPLARGWTIFTGLVLLAVTGVIVRDVLIVSGSIDGRELLPPVFDWIAGLPDEQTGAVWTLWAGIGCALVALFFLAVTIRPRRRTHLTFGGASQLHGRPVDIARLSTAAARRVPGVLSARTVATRRKLSVTAVTAVSPESTGTIKDRVAAEVGDLAALMESTPAVDVTVTTQREDR